MKKMAYVNQHLELFLAYKKAHPELRPQQAQINTNIIWKDAKKEFKRRKPEFTLYIQGVITELNQQIENREAGVVGYVPQIPYIPPLPQGTDKPQPPCSYVPAPSTAYACTMPQALPVTVAAHTRDGNHPFSGKRSMSPSSEEEDEMERRRYSTPVQDALRNQIALLESELNSATLTRNSGLGGPEIDTKIDHLVKSLEDEKRKLAKMIECARRQKSFRVRRKSTFTQLLTNNPDVADFLKLGAGSCKHSGNPPEIVRVVIEIAKFGGFVDIKRSQEIVDRSRCPEEIDKELHKFGLRFQKCSNFWRLLPVGFSPEQGLRYESTVPVRLCHVKANKEHVDHKFCASTMDSIDCVASILGSRQVAMVSQDCRARVPLAISAAGKDTPILVRMEYHDSPEQESVSSSRHKLYLTANAGVTVQDELLGAPEAVGFSGPTYLAIRPGKEIANLAASSANDLERLMWLPAFQDVMRVDGKAKPVLMLTVYGGPDHSPRYSRMVSHMVRIFKKYDHDAVYLSTVVPGKTICNKVERRLAPLSRELFGVVLPHDPFGSHLNDSGVIVDEDLENRNFELVGKVLCETWSRFMIDSHPVFAEYIAHKAEDHSSYQCSEWYSNHIRESQYFLQIVKCSNTSCCAPLRSNLKNVLPNGFFPAPYPLKRRPGGLGIPNPHEINGCDEFAPLMVRQMVNIKPANSVGLELPYDQYCPSVRPQTLGRTCQLCGIYFSSRKNALLHTRDVHKVMGGPNVKVRPRMILAQRRKELLCLLEDPVTGAQDTEWLEEEDVDLVGLSIPDLPQSNVIPIIGDKLSDWVQFPWLPDA